MAGSRMLKLRLCDARIAAERLTNLLCRVGWLTNLFYLAALAYYLYVRIHYTLSGLGAKYEWYGIILLIVECFGATTILMYGMNLLWRPVHEKYPPDPEVPGKPLVSAAHLRCQASLMQSCALPTCNESRTQVWYLMRMPSHARSDMDMQEHTACMVANGRSEQHAGNCRSIAAHSRSDACVSCMQTALPYHIRVMVPCYKEDIDIVQKTIMAAASAELPRGCHRTLYLCDDGKDPEKRKWIESLGPDYVYVSGRSRPKGEMNGKSGNLNNACAQLYPAGVPIPGTELICVFDADQIAKKHFFLATVPLFDGGDDVAMVLSPQAFHNLNLHADIFNHSNIHFWEYMQVRWPPAAPAFAQPAAKCDGMVCMPQAHGPCCHIDRSHVPYHKSAPAHAHAKQSQQIWSIPALCVHVCPRSS